jgi:hypothetical protein
MQRQSYQQILNKLTGLDSWLSSLGLSRQANRIHLHISNIRQLEKIWQDDTLKKGLIKKVGHAQLFWSLTEAAEFADVYSALRNYNNPDLLRKKLQDALKGSVDPNREASESNIGRNTMFELNLASRLFHRGVPVYPQTNPDILCEIDHWKVYIQCKRPFREGKISKNISKAYSQLARDLNDSNDKYTRGIIAISVSHVLNPGDKLFIVKTEHDMMKLLGDHVQKLGERYSRSWKYILDTRIIGISFHLITPAVIEKDKLLTVAQQMVTFDRAVNSSDRLLLDRWKHFLG